MMMENSSQKNATFLDSEFRYTLFPIFYGLVFILGLVFNCYALFILRNIRDSKAISEIRIYMTNLTVADLLFVAALPLWIDYYRRDGNWIFPDVLCRVTGSMFFINTYCSVLFLAIISFNRYWAVSQPLIAASSDHRHRGIYVSIVVWAVVLMGAVPFLMETGITTDERNVSRCFEGYHEHGDETKSKLVVTHFLIVGCFFLVFTLVVVCNALILSKLLDRTLSQPLSQVSVRRWGLQKRALWMVLTVLVVFVVCFLPHHVVQGPWTLTVLERATWDKEPWGQRLNDAHQVTLMLMGLNCLLDPVVYCFTTRNFRNYISSNFNSLWKHQRCSPNTASSHITVDTHQHHQHHQQLLVMAETPPKI